VGVGNLEIENLHQSHVPAAPDPGDIGQTLLELARRVAPGLPASQLHARALSLSDAGLTSMGAVRLMLAIEAAFNIAIPDAELTPANFANLDAVETLVARLRAQPAQ
jgi:acyl carrier protein